MAKVLTLAPRQPHVLSHTFNRGPIQKQKVILRLLAHTYFMGTFRPITEYFLEKSPLRPQFMFLGSSVFYIVTVSPLRLVLSNYICCVQMHDTPGAVQ